MNKIVIVIFLMTAFQHGLDAMEINSNQPLADKGIFILGMTGKEVFQQCARSSQSVAQVWKPTVEQVKIIEKRFKVHMESLEQKFRYLPKSAYHRQYIGYVQNKIEYIYINVYPTDQNRQVNESIRGIANCEKSRKYWGISFNLEDLSFSDIESNDKLDNIKLVLPPENLK